RYAALFFSQNFGKRLFRTRFFSPDLVAVTNIGIGSLQEPLQELPQATYSSMRKGYFESGLLLNNIISSPFSGVGVGAFYRYGPYALEEERDNLRVKLTATILF
ncbi:MAG: hypothetical protein LPK03_03695, partial [Pontibacter sp.]|nr:hypothetical protein [Pontibacter sp.]